MVPDSSRVGGNRGILFRWELPQTRSLHFPHRITLLILLSPMLLFACSRTQQVAVVEEAQTSCFEAYFPAIFGDYLSYPTHKALAVARSADGRFVFAYRTTQRSKERAISATLDECHKRSRWLGLGVDCEVYAVDNEFVTSANEGEE